MPTPSQAARPFPGMAPLVVNLGSLQNAGKVLPASAHWFEDDVASVATANTAASSKMKESTLAQKYPGSHKYERPLLEFTADAALLDPNQNTQPPAATKKTGLGRGTAFIKVPFGVKVAFRKGYLHVDYSQCLGFVVAIMELHPWGRGSRKSSIPLLYGRVL